MNLYGFGSSNVAPDPRGEFEELTEHGTFDLFELLPCNDQAELFETGSLTIIKNGETWVLTLSAKKETQ